MRGIWALCAVLGACSTSSEKPVARRPARDGEALRVALASPYGAHVRAASALVPSATGLAFRARTLHGSLPAHAAADVVIESGAHRISIAPVDVVDAAAEVTENVATYALGDHTMLWSASADAVEELRVLPVARSDYRARYRLGAPGLSARVRDGRIELLDAEGRLVLGSAPVEAADADGQRRLLSATVAADDDSHWSLTISGALEGLRAPIVVDPVWSTVGSLATARGGYMPAKTLSDGRVLTYGGSTAGEASTILSAEVFDPKTNLWSSAGTAPLDLGGLTQLFELASKKVLAIGNSRAALMDVDAATITMISSPYGLPSGAVQLGPKVYVFSNGGTWSWQEGGSFVSLATMPDPVFRAAVAPLPDGRVLLSGGVDVTSKVRSTAYIYDPPTNTWTATAPMADRRQAHALIPLPSGKVLAIGGANALLAIDKNLELFDPATGTWSMGATMPREPSLVSNIYAPSVAFLGNEMYLVDFDGKPRVYDTARDSWAEASAPSLVRKRAALAATGDGRVLMVGGVTTVGVFTPTAQSDAFKPLSAGASCSLAGDCGSAACSDGVCCDRPCTGACERCDLPGSAGTCTALSTPRTATACAPFASCTAGACATSCSSDAACLAGNFCKAGACKPRLPNGAACEAASECASAFCADGVCCQTACTGNCEACDTSGNGACVPVAGKPRGSRPACPAGSEPACGKVCDGVTASTCVYLPAGSSPCGANTCSGGQETRAGTCDGKGACAVAPRSCGAYTCGPTACKSACSSRADCADGFVCVSNACVPAPGLGDGCATGEGCSTGNCVDGVCCASSSCGAGSVCNAAGRKGLCTKSNGVACAMGDDCASGNCADGVCCDAPCDGLCQACDLPGQAGKCAPVSGAPRGKRACPAGDGSPCGQRVCDGKDVSACAGFVGGDIACRSASCSSGESILASACDGKGACGAEEKRSCGLLRCSADATRCLSLCTADADCVDGYQCVGGQCRGKSTACADDGITAKKADGTTVPCSPFACEGGACLTACATSGDCAPGFLCSGGACVNPQPAADSGGCSVASAGARGAGQSGDPWLAFLVLGTVFAATGRRRLLSLVAVSLFGCDSGHAPRADVEASSQALSGAWTVTSETVYPHARNLGSGTYMIGHLPTGAIVGYNSAAERFDAATSTWSMLSVLPEYNHRRGVAELAPGKFLIFGGIYAPGGGFSELLPSIIWQPLGTDAVGGSLNAGRTEFASTVLSTGQVLAAGGYAYNGSFSATFLSSAELYEPTTNTWTLTSPLPSSPRRASILAPLAGGKALLVGDFRNQADLFDASTKTWSAGPSTSSVFNYPLGVTLTGGRFLLVDRGGSATPELYDPTTNSFKRTARPSDGHAEGVLAALPGDRAVLVGGNGTLAIEVYDAATDRWLKASPLPRLREQAFAIDVAGGKVLVAGGSNVAEGYLYDSELFDPRALGAACGGDGDCTSLHCVDGVCCDTGCTESCKACDLPSSKGTCSPVLTGAPRAGHPSCSPYVACNAGVCAATCSGPSDCASTAYCDGTACVVKKAQGAGCSGDEQCSSGFCRDGYCCGSSCGGQCESCGESGSTGTCVAVTGAPRGKRTACTGGERECAARCDGKNRLACAFAPATTACGSDACSGSVETHKRTCDGVGHCNDVPRACGAYACGTTVCLTSCSTGADCAAGFVCSGTTCVPAPGLGGSCADKPCAGSLTCLDGVCCGTSTCPTGSSCGLPARKGTCAKKDGETCATDGECGSGACVDGVCCESACSGQCQACDVPGKLGQCVAVKGAPHGKRPTCSSGASACEATSCDGVDASRCAALPGAEVVCAPAECTAGLRYEAALCSGSGVCGARPAAIPCAPYACDPASKGCRESCTSASDCADGMVCVGARCTPPITTCSSDGASITDGAGHTSSCAPLLCRDGACLETCETSADCAPGRACNSGACVALAPVEAAAEDGGCGVSRGSRGSREEARSGWMVVAAAALALLRGRRDR